MAGVSVNFTLTDLGALNALLVKAHERSLDLQPLMKSIGEASLVTVEERFAGQYGPDGTAWKPSQRALEFGTQTLTLEGHLRDGISAKANSDSAEIGSNLIYARVHQLGYSEGGIDARPYLGIGGNDEETFTELTSDYILGQLAS